MILSLEKYQTWDPRLFSLVILKSRFEATRGLFWDGPLNFFEQWSDDLDGTWQSPLHISALYQQEDVCPFMYDLACIGHHTRRIFSGIGFGPWNPPAPKPRPYHQTTSNLDPNSEQGSSQAMRHGCTTSPQIPSPPQWLWKHLRSPVTKRYKVSHPSGKVVPTVLWDARGVILIDFFTSGTINGVPEVY
ncbi:hypothetical protein AVEN_126645-1 [Araneus ventricosus]|uniref:Uncharacterized protein n=1 Tax=Araneus ventricosus TaxID=182803 RepID=A0A4Y2K2D4_ARAVE|nr:hypothetical protein AVEN_126645-1 [Araneus ventricosus]